MRENMGKAVLIAICCAAFGCLTTLLTEEVQAGLIAAFSTMWLVEVTKKGSDGN